MRTVSLLILLSLFATLLRDAGAADKSVTLTVEEAAGVARKEWPITTGVPFAPGQLTDPSTLRIKQDGKLLPLQTQVTAKWTDGSVKWVLLDTQGTLAPSAPATLQLSWEGGAASPAPAAKVTVTPDANGVNVDTGAITFRLSNTGGGVPESVKIKNGPLVSTGGLHELSYTANGPELNSAEKRGNWKRQMPADAKVTALPATGVKADVTVEQANDLRATVLVKGWYTQGDQKACKFDVRVTAFAGKPYLKIQHTLTYTENPANFFVCGLRMRFDMNGVQDARFGGEAGKLHPVTAPAGTYLLSVGPDIHYNGVTVDAAATQLHTYEMFDGTGKKIPQAEGKDPAGFVSVTGNKSGISVGVRDFRLLHPKELVVDEKGVEVGLWPRHGGLLADGRNSLYGQRIRGETTLNGVACGWAKTHEVWVAYTDGTPATAQPAQDAVKAAAEPAYAIVAPAHICGSGAMGILAATDREKFPGLERQQDTLWAWVIRNRELFHWDGFFDYGGILIEFDNHGQRYSNGPKGTWVWRDYAGWILNDGQVSHQIFRAQVCSGSRNLLKLAESVARNIGDVTTVHYQNPKVPGSHPVGGSHRHDMLHWGAIVTSYGMDALGNCDLWYLTGDLRSRDNLRDYADNISKGGPGLIEKHGMGSVLCRIGEALEQPNLIEAGKKALPADIKEALKPNFRSWTDNMMPMILAYDITKDEALKKGLLDATDALAEKGHMFGGEIAAWSYLQTKDAKYIETLKKCAALNGNVTRAAGNNGNPYEEPWKKLRERMDQMPAWYVKIYINTQCVGRYPAMINALKVAGLDEKALGLK